MKDIPVKQGMTPDPLYSIYLHIPFCRSRCDYCGFNTFAGIERLLPSYIEALLKEIASVGVLQSLASHTLYIGGGTPSLLTPGQIQRLIAAARDRLGLDPEAEITLEANPDTVTRSSLTGYRKAGVNRLSLGVQSTHDRDLAAFGRTHRFAGALDAITAARTAGFHNISIDLIYGAHTQTLESWRQSLDIVLALEPQHISLYSLSVEPGTRLETRVLRGLAKPPDPELAADMYDLARDRLAGGGYEHYEISNWARVGYASQHNRHYWLNRPYLGFGAGAHGYGAGLRYWNISPVPDYIEAVLNGQDLRNVFAVLWKMCSEQ
jgi:oxygen-independent coproporphyrinogen-3 oxidase